jgi:hypothetical protein
MYYEYGLITIAFPAWTPEDMGRMTRQQRKYWSEFSLARHEQKNLVNLGRTNIRNNSS